MNNPQVVELENKSLNEAEIKKLLSFFVDKESYGLDIMKVKEIKSWEEPTIIPESPEYMKGVIDLRGTVVPIFDLKKKFGLEEIKVDESKVVIVLDVSGKTIGVLVDAVSDILTVNKAEIKESPQASDTQVDQTYIDGLISENDQMVILLNVEKLFDMEVINKTTNNQ